MANRNFARVTRRKTQWAGFGDASAGPNIPSWLTLTAGTPVILSTAVIIQGQQGLLDEQYTITRMIGSVAAQLDVTTAEAGAAVAFGCVLASLEAITIGVTALPSVEDDPDVEWLFYGIIPLVNPQNVLQDGSLSSYTMPFDVRGQRIVRAGTRPVWIAEAQDFNCRAWVGGRYLAKLT